MLRHFMAIIGYTLLSKSLTIYEKKSLNYDFGTFVTSYSNKDCYKLPFKCRFRSTIKDDKILKLEFVFIIYDCSKPKGNLQKSFS